MLIKKIIAKEVKDSRNEPTISVIVETSKGKFETSSPSGKSTGKHEVKPYHISLEEDINYINNLTIDKINEIINSKKLSVNVNRSFKILKKIESLIKNNLGGNSLFALEASLLKTFAKEKNQELWKFLSNKKNIKNKKLSKINKIKIRPVGNAIGGGLHSKGINGKKPDFQEFLFIPKEKSIKENIKLNEIAYKISGKLLKTKSKKRNDEGGWETNLDNESVLDIMKKTQQIIKNKYKKQIDIGLDVAASSFYNKNYKYNNYNLKNKNKKLTSKEQIDHISKLIKKYNLVYVEDPLNENDFSGFNKLLKKIRKTNCLTVGDDLTVTNPLRLKKAIKKKSIDAIIIKPNQIGSLIKVKQAINIAKKNKLAVIISHRSGETLDNTIADLAIAFNCNFIKTGIYGKERKAKLNRLTEIEK